MELSALHGGRGRSRAEVFVGMDLTPYLAQARATGLRSTSTYVRTSRQRPTEAFARTLDQVQSSSHAVRPGETLSEIVLERLKQRGQSATGTDLYERVREVARDNGIADPDVIVPGQLLDLDALDGVGGPHRPETSDSFRVPPIVPAPPRSSVNMSRSIEDIVSGDTRISSGFGLRHDPFDGDLREHRGIDIAARRGSPIFPIDDGVVVFSGWHGGHGKTVIVRHENGTETVYAHADELLVDAGETVGVSDKLGLVGSTGRSTGPHLHFEVRQGGVAVDPLAALSAHDHAE